MAKALMVIDVQNDFCEGGVLACSGGAQVASRITKLLQENKASYDYVIGSRDWHTPNSENGGHFPADGQEPDFVNTWPLHCLADTPGSEYHPNLDQSLIDIHIKKGQGQHGYSIFEGTDESGTKFEDLLKDLNITEVDVVGIATDYCVRASALDSNRAGLKVRVVTGLTAGVSQGSTEAAIDEMVDQGIEVSPVI